MRYAGGSGWPRLPGKTGDFRRDRWQLGPDSEPLTGREACHSRPTAVGLGEKGRLFFLYSRKEITRAVLLDTNNLVIDILPGKGTVLERFKLVHRAVDVLKAMEEKEHIHLENRRRKKLVDSGKLVDPYIGKVTVVADADKLSDILNLGVTFTTDDSD